MATLSPDSAIYRLLRVLAANEARRLLREAVAPFQGQGGPFQGSIEELAPLLPQKTDKNNQ